MVALSVTQQFEDSDRGQRIIRYSSTGADCGGHRHNGRVARLRPHAMGRNTSGLSAALNCLSFLVVKFERTRLVPDLTAPGAIRANARRAHTDRAERAGGFIADFFW
jgi:hypothetical protein